MQRRLDDATVVNLWALFERSLIEHVTASWPDGIDRPETFVVRLQEKAAREIERWRVEELLDLYKGWVGSETLGAVKQVKSYRDWVAHRNPRKVPSAVIRPEPAFGAVVAMMQTVVGDEPGGSQPAS